MIKIKVSQLTEGKNKELWIWKIKSGKHWFCRSYYEYADAWLANRSADKMKKLLENNGSKNIKIDYGEYDIPKTHHKFYSKRTKDKKATETPYGYSIVEE